MKNVSLLLMLGLLSCAHAQKPVEAFGTYNGMKIYNHTNHDLPPSLVNAVVGMTLEYLDGTEVDVRGYTVRFFPMLFQLNFPETNTVVFADGMTDVGSKTMYISSFTSCVPASSLSHELAHLVKFRTITNGDAEHKDVEFWHKVSELERNLQKSFCTDSELDREAVNRQPPNTSNRR